MFVHGAGTHRRIQGLAVNGWSLRRLARLLGQTEPTVRYWLDQTLVSEGTAADVRTLYDRLWDRPPPAVTAEARRNVERTRRGAARRGWVPPMAWDDGALDDPAAVPSTPGTGKGGRQAALVAAEVEHFRLFEVPPEKWAARLGMSQEALTVALKRHRARVAA